MDLFYRQGYQATGINQIIAEAGVARASFYNYFPSKDDLFIAYAEAISEQETQEMRDGIEALDTPRERFYGLLNLLPAWLQEFDYRGCPFQIMLAESPKGDERWHAVARDHHEHIMTLIREMAEAYYASNPELKPVDIDHLVRQYTILVDGAIAAAVAYRERWPIDEAINSIESLVEPDD